MSTLNVRWSAIKTWRKCQMLYNYRYIRQLKKRRPAVPLIRGSIIGELLDKRAERKKPTKVIQKYEEEYGKLFSAERELYGDIIPECLRIVDNYKALYKNEGLTYLKGKDGKPYELIVETEFTVEGQKVHFQGHIDKLVQDENDMVLVLDHKSHKVIPDANTRFSDLQLLTYIWLLPLSGYPKPDGLIWDYLRTKPPAIPELLKKGGLTRRANIDTDYSTYLAEIEKHGLNPEDYQEELQRLKVSSAGRYFDRVKLPSPPKGMIDQVVKEFKSTIIQIRDVSKTGTYVRNMGRDCSWCEFFDLCSAEIRGLDTNFILKTEYVQVEGDPHYGKTRRIK